MTPKEHAENLSRLVAGLVASGHYTFQEDPRRPCLLKVQRDGLGSEEGAYSAVDHAFKLWAHIQYEAAALAGKEAAEKAARSAAQESWEDAVTCAEEMERWETAEAEEAQAAMEAERRAEEEYY